MTDSTNFTANVPLPSGTNTLSVVTQDTGGNVTTKRFSTVTPGTAPTALTYDLNGNTLTDDSELHKPTKAPELPKKNKR